MTEGNGFEPPHVNGNGNGSHNGNGSSDSGEPAIRHRPPWEFMILGLFVALLCIGIILGWTLVGSKSPERLNVSAADAYAAACNRAQTALKALPNSNPVTGPDRIARIRAENDVLRDMVSSFGEVRPQSATQQKAVQGWSEDWTSVIEARDTYADKLESGETDLNKKFQFVMPVSKSGSVKPVTLTMDDFVRENHPRLDACFVDALQLDVVEGQREYKEIHQ